MYSNDQPKWDSEAPRRILGMKIWQAALLVGMAVMDCLVVVVGIAILLGSVLPAASGGPAAKLPSTPTPKLATVTIGPTLSPTPSETPLTMIFSFPTFTPYGTPADTHTPSPTATDLLEGWTKFFVREVEIWMPVSYAGGDPHSEAKAIIASLKEKGANYNWDFLEEEMTTASDNYVLWGIDSYQGNPSIVTNVAIIYDFPNPGEPLADYATRFIGAMSGDYLLIEQQKVRHSLYEVERVILETKNSDETPMRFVLYAVRDQNIVWNILCVTAVDEMDGRLSAFNRMVDTFRVLAVPE